MTLSPSNKTALDVRDLSVFYDRSDPALDHVSFQVSPGSITVVIGPNGSGKSTLIKAILGLIEYEGEVRLFEAAASQKQHEIGYVPQRYMFDVQFPITALEFVQLAQVHADKKEVTRVFSIVGAEKLITQQLRTLSGGELQRVLLARALVNKPKLLVLDEPEAGVDVGGEQTFYDLIETLAKQEQLSILLASHELDVVFAYADQVICLNKRMLCAGAPTKVLNQNTFAELYGKHVKFYDHGCASHDDQAKHHDHTQRRKQANV